MVPHADQPHTGTNGKKQSSRGMAQSRTIHPRGHQLYPLPGTIQATAARSENEVSRNVQRIGRILRITG